MLRIQKGARLVRFGEINDNTTPRTGQPRKRRATRLPLDTLTKVLSLQPREQPLDSMAERKEKASFTEYVFCFNTRVLKANLRSPVGTSSQFPDISCLSCALDLSFGLQKWGWFLCWQPSCSLQAYLSLRKVREARLIAQW